jgi:hypothetical protein
MRTAAAALVHLLPGKDDALPSDDGHNIAVWLLPYDKTAWLSDAGIGPS